MLPKHVVKDTYLEKKLKISWIFMPNSHPFRWPEDSLRDPLTSLRGPLSPAPCALLQYEATQPRVPSPRLIGTRVTLVVACLQGLMPGVAAIASRSQNPGP